MGATKSHPTICKVIVCSALLFCPLSSKAFSPYCSQLFTNVYSFAQYQYLFNNRVTKAESGSRRASLEVSFKKFVEDFIEGEVPTLDQSSAQQYLRLLVQSGLSPKSVAGLQENTPMHVAILLNMKAELESLLQSGGDINATDSSGYTLFHVAIDAKNSELANYLLQNGARAISQTADGTTPLHTAVFNKDADMVRLLLNLGLQPDAVDTYNKTPLSLTDGIPNTELREEIKKLLTL